MKKLLVLNGSHSDIPLIQAGKNLGYYVITTGRNPELIGNQYADEYQQADFSNLEAICELAKRMEIDAICSCANDFGAITASYVAEKLGLPGHDSYQTSLILHHKDRFKEFAREYEIKTPLAESFSVLENAIQKKSSFSYPVMVKPIDLTGGKGVTTVSCVDEYEAAVKKAFVISRQARIVVEPFIEGTQHSFSTFLIDKKVAFYFSDNEYSYLNPYLVSTSAAPADNIELVKDSLITEAEKIAQLLKLVDGLFHMQYILKNGKPFILEITRRCSGDFYPDPVLHATGVDWAKWIVRAESGMDCSEFPYNIKQRGFCGRHCIMGNKNGIVDDVVIAKELKKNIYDEFLWWEKGTRINDYLVDKLGILFLKYDSREEMIEKSKHINEMVQVQYK